MGGSPFSGSETATAVAVGFREQQHHVVVIRRLWVNGCVGESGNVITHIQIMSKWSHVEER